MIFGSKLITLEMKLSLWQPRHLQHPQIFLGRPLNTMITGYIDNLVVKILSCS